jgi:hypothetical protein
MGVPMRLLLAAGVAVAAVWIAVQGLYLLAAAPDHRDTNLYPAGFIGLALATLFLAVAAALVWSRRRGRRRRRGDARL